MREAKKERKWERKEEEGRQKEGERKEERKLCFVLYLEMCLSLLCTYVYMCVLFVIVFAMFGQFLYVNFRIISLLISNNSNYIEKNIICN